GTVVGDDGDRHAEGPELPSALGAVEGLEDRRPRVEALEDERRGGDHRVPHGEVEAGRPRVFQGEFREGLHVPIVTPPDPAGKPVENGDVYGLGAKKREQPPPPPPPGGPYNVLITDEARKAYDKLPGNIQKAMADKMEQLKAYPEVSGVRFM